MREEVPDSTQGSTLNLRAGRAPRTDFGRVTGRTFRDGAEDKHQSPEWMEHRQPRQTAYTNHLIHQGATHRAPTATSDSDSGDPSQMTILSPTCNFQKADDRQSGPVVRETMGRH